jgi:hypothetical protein
MYTNSSTASPVSSLALLSFTTIMAFCGNNPDHHLYHLLPYNFDRLMADLRKDSPTIELSFDCKELILIIIIHTINTTVAVD